MIKGQVISGEFGKVVIRKKCDSPIEIGELLVSDSPEGKVLLQVYDLLYGSQISQQNLELVSGLNLEEHTDFSFMDPQLRNYQLAALKPVLWLAADGSRLCKSLPGFFSTVREIEKADFDFLGKPEKSLFLGKVRSGSRVLDVDVYLPGEKVFSHHVLICATTGRGKSNLTSVMLWNSVDKDYCGILVLDPHDEYYGRSGLGLRDHPQSGKVVYYSPNPPPGGKSLKINLSQVEPSHFNGATYFSDPQKQAMMLYHRQFGSRWIEALLKEEPLREVKFFPETLSVVKRKLLGLLDIAIVDEQQLECQSIFDFVAGTNTIPDICRELEQSKKVIVDTSLFSGAVEILVGSLITSEVFKRYKLYKMQGQLDDKPVISVVLEEAPRVLGKEVIAQGSNVFSTIAREGRKFKVGLTAITQLPSLIPRDILANMNTKIILGLEMGPERQAIIESASQDLSTDNRTIASLDKGEALITSNFAKFAIPVKIPLFDQVVKETKKNAPTHQQGFGGVSLS